MPRSNGIYSLPPGYLGVTGQVILASQHNGPLEDIAQALTGSLPRDGTAPMLANLPMGGFKATGMAQGTDAGDGVTKAQLDAAIAALTPATAEISFFARSTAPAGWVRANGGTIGNAASGGTTRANADTVNLFTVLWDNFSNIILPIQTSTGAASTRGATAAADYAANKRLTIPELRGEFLRAWDDARGIDPSRAIGTAQADLLEGHTHTLSGSTGIAGQHKHNLSLRAMNGDVSPGSGYGTITFGAVPPDQINTPGNRGAASDGLGAIWEDGNHSHTLAGTATATGGTETRPRNLAYLACIKL